MFINKTFVVLILCKFLVLSAYAQIEAGQAPTPLQQQVKQAEQVSPQATINLIKQILAKPDNVNAKEKLWLLSSLSHAFQRAKQFEDALNVARQGQFEAQAIPLERIRFGALAIQILHDARRDLEAKVEFEKIATLLNTQASTTPSPSRQINIETARAWLIGGTVMSALGQTPEAMDLLTKALRIYDELGDLINEQADCINEIAFIHYKLGQTTSALREEQRAIDLLESNQQKDSLSRYYLRKAHFLSATNHVDEQYQALLTARKMAQEEGNDYNLAVIATNIADVALQKKDYSATLRYAEEAIPLAEKSKDRESLLTSWINKGIAQNRLGNPTGLHLIRQALEEFSADKGMQESATEVQWILSEELAFNRDFENAYKAVVNYETRKETLLSEADKKRIANTEAAYQADKKQRQIEALELERRTESRFRLLWILAGGLGALVIVILLVSRYYLKRAYRKVRDMALRDPLTGLRNRRYLSYRIDEDLGQIRRQRLELIQAQADTPLQNADVIFMMIDLDHFKSVNDEFGHPAGDAVLKQFSDTLMQELRDADTVVRWGGEEFLVVAKQATASEAHLLAERLRACIEKYPFKLSEELVLQKTCSIGFTCFPFDASDTTAPNWENVIELADQCLYAAKMNGRNAWVGIVPRAGTPALPDQMRVESGIKDGLFDLYHSFEHDLVWHT